MFKKIKIYTEATLLKNPGTGSWVFTVICDNSNYIASSGTFKEPITSNRSKMIAFIKAVNKASLVFNNFENITFYSNLQLLVDAFNQNWIEKWRSNNWKTKDGYRIDNKDLWEVIVDFKKDKKINLLFEKVSGSKKSKKARKLSKEINLSTSPFPFKPS